MKTGFFREDIIKEFLEEKQRKELDKIKNPEPKVSPWMKKKKKEKAKRKKKIIEKK